MKKFLSISLATLLAVSVFAGCAKQTSLPENANVPAQGDELASTQTATPTSRNSQIIALPAARRQKKKSRRTAQLVTPGNDGF